MVLQSVEGRVPLWLTTEMVSAPNNDYRSTKCTWMWYALVVPGLSETSRAAARNTGITYGDGIGEGFNHGADISQNKSQAPD